METIDRRVFVARERIVDYSTGKKCHLGTL